MIWTFDPSYIDGVGCGSVAATNVPSVGICDMGECTRVKIVERYLCSGEGCKCAF